MHVFIGWLCKLPVTVLLHTLHVHIIWEMCSSWRCILELSGASPASLHATHRDSGKGALGFGQTHTRRGYGGRVRADADSCKARSRGHGTTLSLAASAR
jgi:hypothetical protein